MTSNSDNNDTNVAEILHNIAADADAVSGKIIKQATKAAHKGLSSIKVKISKEDYESVVTGPLTPPMEKLVSLGFKLEAKYEFTLWSWGTTEADKVPILTVKW